MAQGETQDSGTCHRLIELVLPVNMPLILTLFLLSSASDRLPVHRLSGNRFGGRCGRCGPNV